MSDAFRPEPRAEDVWRHATVSCPACGYRFDAASTTDGQGRREAPGDGDFGVCFRCGEVLKYVVGAVGAGVREASTAELVDFNRMPGMTRLVRDIHLWRGAGRR